jgi:serine/threonine protein kinase
VWPRGKRRYFARAALRDLCGQVLRTVRLLHDGHFLLGDAMKPDNWLVHADAGAPSGWKLEVTDLGSDTFTKPYLSPLNRNRLERNEPLAFSAAADMWAVGATFFYLATGKPFADTRAFMQIDSSVGTEDATVDVASRHLAAIAHDIPEPAADADLLSLLAQLLVADDALRLSAAQALQHAFMTQ